MAYRIRWTKEQQLEFAGRWLRFRERYGVTQKVMSELLSIHVNTCNRIERGKFVPRNETVIKFAELERRYREEWKREAALNWVPGGEI